MPSATTPSSSTSMVDTYLAEAPGFLAAIDAASRPGMPRRSSSGPHAQGQQTTMGATRLAEIARSLEERARGGVARRRRRRGRGGHAPS